MLPMIGAHVHACTSMNVVPHISRSMNDLPLASSSIKVADSGQHLLFLQVTEADR